ncbi:MAG: GntR family transcriptional regulator [Verrucomicrobia bacterium]|nr:GntR family transcriptional regulator [Verrucomicrobiota bacterium]
MADHRIFLPPLSAAAPGPLYQQIVDGLKREVSSGRLPGGTALPSFRALAQDLMVSVITVKRAYEDLEREGIILRRQGLGTFVAEGGEDRGRQAKLAHASSLFAEGCREASDAGLKRVEIENIFREALKKLKESS